MIYHGANTIPEGLEIGEIKVNGTAGFDELEPIYIIAFTGDHIGNIQITTNGWEFNGIPSSVCFIACLGFVLNTLLQVINNDGNGDKILNVFSIPKLAVNSLVPVDPPRNNNLLVANSTCNS